MGSFSIYKRMMVFLKPYLLLFLFAAVLSTFVSLVDSVSLWILSTLPKILFNPDSISLVKPELSFSNVNAVLKYYSFAIISKNKNPLAYISVFVILSFLLKNIILFVAKAITHNVNLSISRDMRAFVYRHVMNLPMSYFDKNESGKIVSYMVYDLNQINVTITETVQKLTMEPVKLIINLSILMMINLKLTLIIFLIYPVLGFLISKIGQSVRRRINRELESFSDMLTHVTEIITNMRAVKMFNMHDEEFNRFNTLNKKYKRNNLKSQLTRETLSPITEVLGAFVTVFSLWIAGNDILNHRTEFTADDFVRFLFFLFASYAPIKSLGSVNNTIQAGISAGKRVFALIDEKEEALHSGKNRASEIAFNDNIVFDNVKFSYPGYDEFVLKGLNFIVEKGTTVAIVGSSGAGKSTILDLLPRFYEVTEGDILIDNYSTREMDLVILRSLFGIVSQETILFNTTVRENIAYGTQKHTEEEIINAINSANAMEFIEKLPQGLDTVIGEKGVTLSGGQRQRLSIARALLRDPQILIFDEATSALDTESEKMVQEAIDNLTRTRTTFVVAHRLSTVLSADKIIVLENGVVVEEGTHNDLIELGNRYKYFYDIQFKNEDSNE